MLRRVRRRETVKRKEAPGDALARSFIVETLLATQDRSMARMRPLLADDLLGGEGAAAEAEFQAAADATLERQDVALVTPTVLADMVASWDEFPHSAYV